MLPEERDRFLILIQFRAMLLPVFFLKPSLQKIFLDMPGGVVLPSEMNLFVDCFDPCIRLHQSFLNGVLSFRNLLPVYLQISYCIVPVLLYVNDGPGHFLQIGELHFPGIGSALLCLDISLRIVLLFEAMLGCVL